MTTFEEATTARTAEEVRDDLLAALVAEGVAATGWDSVAVHRAILEADAAARAKEESYRVLIAKAGFLRTAADAGDAWLDLLAAGFFNRTRAPATRAVHRVRFTNATAAGPYVLEASAQVVATVAGTTFRNTPLDDPDFSHIGTLFAGVGQTVDVDFTAEVDGSAGNAPTGTVLKLVTAIPGVTVVNTEILEPGRDAESNAALLLRCLSRWAATSYAGCLEAYVQWVREAFTGPDDAPTGVESPITKVYADDTNPNGPGSTDVYLATDAGAATVEQVAQVDAYLQPRRGLGTGPLRTFAGTEVAVPISVKVFATKAVAAAVEAGLLTLNADTAMGGRLFVAEIIQRSQDVDSVFNTIVLSPLTDVQLGVGEIAVISVAVEVVAQ